MEKRAARKRRASEQSGQKPELARSRAREGVAGWGGIRDSEVSVKDKSSSAEFLAARKY